MSTASTKGHGDGVGGLGGARREGPVRHVLVVEDEAIICVDTAETLDQQGFVTHTALSAEEALARLRNGLRVDILFTDINLAGVMDGATLARAARELLPTLIVVYTSGTVVAVAQAVAGSTLVPKPYNPERVGRMLRAMRAPSLVESSPVESSLVE